MRSSRVRVSRAIYTGVHFLRALSLSLTLIVLLYAQHTGERASLSNSNHLLFFVCLRVVYPRMHVCIVLLYMPLQ